MNKTISFYPIKITPESKLRVSKLPVPESCSLVKQEAPSEPAATTLENASQLSAWSMCLPACRISESVQQLMELALNTLGEAVKSSAQWCVLTVAPSNCNFVIPSTIHIGVKQ